MRSLTHWLLSMDPNLKLSLRRTYLANERTQMAWIRTAFTLISFGFGIAHCHRFLHHTRGPLGPGAIGMMIAPFACRSLTPSVSC